MSKDYKKVKAGELKKFTGIDSSYKAPTTAELGIDCDSQSVDEAITQLISDYRSRRLS